jgi:hypothetical protein
MKMFPPRSCQNGSLSGLDLLRSCQRLAQCRTWHEPQPFLHPCGARIFYYTRLTLLRRGVQPAMEPTRTPVSQQVASSFLRMAPHVADRLAEEFGWAVRLLTEPAVAVPQLLLQRPQPVTPALQKRLAALAGVAQLVLDDWPLLWQASLQHAQGELKTLLSPTCLLIAPVARADDPFGVALKLLHARLAQDVSLHSQQNPLSGVYVYDEPLVQWLMWQLLMQPWFRDVWQSEAASLRGSKACLEFSQ